MSSSANDRQPDFAISTHSAATGSQQQHSHSSVPVGSVQVIDNFLQPNNAARPGSQARSATLHRVGSTGVFRPDDTEVSRSLSNLYNLQVNRVNTTSPMLLVVFELVAVSLETMTGSACAAMLLQKSVYSCRSL